MKGLRAGFLNACSLKKHINDFRQYLCDNPPYDIFGVVETRSTVDQSVVDIRGYSLARQDRNSRGVGVALYFKDSLKFTLLAQSDTTLPKKPLVPEYIMGFIQDGKLDSIFACVAYKPTDVDIEATPSFLKELRKHSSEYRHKIIMGDFNANLLFTHNDAKFLVNLAGELALKIVNHGPTNFAKQPGTWIDAILIDNNETILMTENQPAPFHNQHNLIEITLDLSPPASACEPFTYRDFTKVDVHDLNSALSGCDWGQFDSNVSDLETLLRCLTDNVSGAINTLVPEKTVHPKERQPPWVNTDLTLLRKKTRCCVKAL